MSLERIAEIRAAEQDATPGPWELRTYWEDSCLRSIVRSEGGVVARGFVAHDLHTQDAAFIILAREAVPELLAEVERLDQERRRLDQRVADLERQIEELQYWAISD